MRVIASSFIAVAGIAAAGATPWASAGLVNPLIPTWAGQANTQSASWDTFTQASGGANLPEAGGAPFSLMNFGAASFITGSGNIYSITAPLYVMIMGGTLGNGQTPLQVVMNVATVGTTIAPASVKLTLWDATGMQYVVAPTASEIRSDAPAQPQGSIRTTAYTWDTAAAPITASGFRFEFLASGPSMSLDAVRLDMQYVPAPGALALLGMAAFVARRKRRA
jgi:hypothetical protein